MDELLNKAAEKMGMPPSLAKRSAQARADKEGITLEAVLAEWAGEQPSADAVDEAATPAETTDAAALDSPNEGADSPPAATSAPDPVPSAPAEAAGAPTSVSTEYLVGLAAASKRMPEKLVRSSAEARARNAGTSIDSVLATWAGVDLDDLRARAEAGLDLPIAERPGQPTATPAPETPESADAAEPEPEVAPAAEQAATPPAAAAAASMSMDELLEKVAEAKGMPVPIAKRSAEARAKKTGEPLEAVLAEWAGVDPASVGGSTDAATPQPEPADASAEPTAASSADSPPAPAAATMSMDELLEKVAEAKGMPVPIAKRSAEARAKKTGEPLEAVLAEWAGIDPATIGAPSGAATPQPEAQASTPAEPATQRDDAPAADDVEVIAAAATGRSDGAEGDRTELAVSSRRGGYPTWLAAAFIIIPLLAVTYILVSPNGPDCGTAGQLNIDPATGLAVNCDGSEYGSSTVDYLSMGAGIYAQCAACHGADGGGGVGPAFAGGAVLATFPACTDHVVWVTLGTANFPDPTYGATNKPVGGGGVMPGYDGVLTPEQIAAVSLYERVAFGGQDRATAEIDCGLVEAVDETVEASQP
jgi:mono/diheme cytochrome c family protein